MANYQVLGYKYDCQKCCFTGFVKEEVDTLEEVQKLLDNGPDYKWHIDTIPPLKSNVFIEYQTLGVVKEETWDETQEKLLEQKAAELRLKEKYGHDHN